MRVWLIQIGEPLPVDGEAPRLLRTGMMAQQLVERGHDVTWWCSTFNHWTKSHRYTHDTTLELRPRYRLRLLHSPGYARNVSFSRIIDHRALARKLEKEIAREVRPDVILSSLPTVEMSEVATRFGRKTVSPLLWMCATYGRMRFSTLFQLRHGPWGNCFFMEWTARRGGLSGQVMLS